VKALFSRTALTVAHLDEMEAHLRSEHHLADEHPWVSGFRRTRR
jgi:hypothetical protein